MTNEERQLIFKLRARVTDVKMNFKRKYEDLNCESCKMEEETQKHVLECTEIEKKQPELTSKVEYEKLFNGSIEEKVTIARSFKEKMKIRGKVQM